MTTQTQRYLRPITFQRGDTVILFCLTIAIVLACLNIHSLVLSCVMMTIILMQPEVSEQRGFLCRNTWRHVRHIEHEAMAAVGDLVCGKAKIGTYIIMILGCMLFGMYLGFASLVYVERGFTLGCFVMLSMALAFFYCFSYFPWKSMELWKLKNKK